MRVETAVSFNLQTETVGKVDRYYVDTHAQQNGDYEIHRQDCPYRSYDSQDLGYHKYGYSAMMEAQKAHPIINGCLHCCKEQHT